MLALSTNKKPHPKDGVLSKILSLVYYCAQTAAAFRAFVAAPAV